MELLEATMVDSKRALALIGKSSQHFLHVLLALVQLSKALFTSPTELPKEVAEGIEVGTANLRRSESSQNGVKDSTQVLLLRQGKGVEGRERLFCNGE